MPRPATAVGAGPPTSTPVRLNNRLRRAVEAALGGLTLLSPDPGQAARRPRSRCSSRATRQCAAARSTPRSPRRPTAASSARSIEARAADPAVKADATDAEKLDAVAVDRGARRPGGAGAADRPAGDAAAGGRSDGAADAIAAIAEQLALWAAVQNAWYGLSLGSVLLLAAIGLAITFGVMGVINMAHGEMVMIGAYVTFVVQEVIRTCYPGAVRLFAADRRAAGLPRRRRDRHR